MNIEKLIYETISNNHNTKKKNEWNCWKEEEIIRRIYTRGPYRSQTQHHLWPKRTIRWWKERAFHWGTIEGSSPFFLFQSKIKSNQIKSQNKIDLGWGFDLFANFIKGKINETGLQTSRVYQGLYGPILSKPEKGPDFRFTLTYLGRVWLVYLYNVPL